jgi:hypothetical protein
MHSGRLPTTSADTKADGPPLAARGSAGSTPVLAVSVGAVSVARALVASLLWPCGWSLRQMPAPPSSVVVASGVVETFRADPQLRAGCSSITRQGNHFMIVVEQLRRAPLDDGDHDQDDDESGQ